METMVIIDNCCPYTIQQHLCDGTINTTDLYGSFQIQLLTYFLLYRNRDVTVLLQLIQLCIEHGSDINQWVMDTDDEWMSPLKVMVVYYIGACVEHIETSRKMEILGVIAWLVNNGANPMLESPTGCDSITPFRICQDLRDAQMRPPVSRSLREHENWCSIKCDAEFSNMIDSNDITILCIILKI